MNLPFPLVEGLTALQSLSLQYDRRIPEPLLRSALDFDRANGHRPHGVARIRVANVRMKRQVAVDLMALVIVRAAAARGTVERCDFHGVGFTDAQIAELRAEAYARACADEPRLPQMLEAA